MTAPSLIAAVGIVNLSNGSTSSTITVPRTHFEQAGANRRPQFKILMRNGGGTAKQPTTVTIGGVAVVKSAGEDVATATNRVCNATWGIIEVDIALMNLNVAETGYELTMSGQSGTVRTVLMYIVQDTDQTTLGDTEHLFLESGGGSLPLVRAGESFTMFSAYVNSVTTLTLAEPARDTFFNDSSNGTQINIGYEADTARTVNATFSSGGFQKSANIINFLPVPNQAITSVNGGTNTVEYGAAFTWSHTGFASAPNAATIAGVSCSAVTTSGGAAPALVDETVVPAPGARTLVGSNGSVSANFAVTVQVPAGFQAVQLAGTLNTTNTGCIHNFSPAAAVGHWIIAPTANNTIVYPNGDFDTDLEGEMLFFHLETISPLSDAGNARSYNLTIDEDGEVTKVIRVKFFESIGFIAKKITAKFF